MDIELSLRQLQGLRDPGVRFTDGVMSRIGDAPLVEPRDGVVQIADARARKRSHRILIATVVAVAAAAAVPTLTLLRDGAEPQVVQLAAAPPASQLPGDGQSPVIHDPVEVQSGESGPARNPLDCLDLDVIRGILLLGSGNQTFNLAAELPSDLAGFKAPDQLTWVGSTERTYSSMPQSTSSAVYRANLAPAAAQAVAARALTAGGWQLHDASWAGSANIFTAGDSVQNSETYCREGKPVSLGASSLDGVTYVVLSASRILDRTSGMTSACDQPPQPVRTASALDNYMPRLETPLDPATRRPVAVSDGGGSNGDTKRSSNAVFVIQSSVGSVAQHFASQLAQQGWSAEAAWNGAGTAGSTWTRRGDADAAMLGTLVVSAFEGNRFTAVFQVVRTR